MELSTNLNQTLFPGQRLIKLKGWEAADKYPFPRDCEGVMFDEDEDYFYIKKTDTNGGVSLFRYKYEEDPIPHFDPKKYVTVDDFNSFKEDILNGFNDLKQSFINGSGSSNWSNESAGSNANSAKPNKSVNKSNNGIS